MISEQNSEHPILITGGGASGELMARALSCENILCKIIAPTPSDVVAPNSATSQARTIAIWQGGLQYLEKIFGNTDFLQDGYPINAMALIDENAQETCYLPEDADIEEDFFGYNLNLAALTERTRKMNMASGLVDYHHTQSRALLSAGVLRTADNTTHHAPLIIVAEGKDSATAQQAGITPLHYQAGTVAVITVVQHETPHCGFAREYHRKPGPLAFVPLDENFSSIVWIQHNNHDTKRMLNNKEQFLQQLNADSFDQLGIVNIIEPPKAIALTSRQTCTFRAERLALIGESAHKMPPTGAQGLNLTLRDIHDLQTRISDTQQTGGDVGCATLLRAYSANRLKDTLAVSSAVHMGNASIRLGGPLAWLRRAAQNHIIPQFPKAQQSLIRHALFGF